MPTSAEFRALAEMRLQDAEDLLVMKRWSCAYYIAGYAVECALKAVIVRRVEQTGAIFADKKEGSHLLDGFYVHELEKLFKTADLERAFGAARGSNPTLNKHWDTVKDWKETSRYQQYVQSDAEKLVQAINHQPDGVMQWIRDHW